MRTRSILKPFLFIVIITLCQVSCRQGKNKPEATQVATITPNISAMKISGAVSCTKGLSPGDSTVFMNGGGADFITTTENEAPADPEKIAGMVYIPGGTFSMGGVNPVGITEGGHEAMEDARPIHEVYVDAFYMDETEVTNRQFAAFVKATVMLQWPNKNPPGRNSPAYRRKRLLRARWYLRLPGMK
ncbi:MAG TPA: SUMF1/EgtB/PvdO family nonheme iron enzyme [Agriterribacter sp.]|nr:SUMF1/EgtB/PvdO family nonheme iron enzyme [Agriterribacter sp.]